MFRMRVKEISLLDTELDKKVSEVLINIVDSQAISLQEFSSLLDTIDRVLSMEIVD